MGTTRFYAQAGSLSKSENSSFVLIRDHKPCCLFMGLFGLYMGKVTRLRKKLLSSAVFLKLMRFLVLSDPACVENRVQDACKIIVFIFCLQMTGVGDPRKKDIFKAFKIRNIFVC